MNQDVPLSTGMLDESIGSLFSVDAFGAILPEATEDLSVVPPEALAGGLMGWAALGAEAQQPGAAT